MLIALTFLLQAAAPPVALKTCPDESVIHADEQCIVFPDHRYLLAHQPMRSEQVERWWCGRDAHPTEVRIRLEQMQEGGSVATLQSLKVAGRQPSAAVLSKVRAQVAAAADRAILDGRCLSKQGRGPVPVFTIGQGSPEIELR